MPSDSLLVAGRSTACSSERAETCVIAEATAQTLPGPVETVDAHRVGVRVQRYIPA